MNPIRNVQPQKTATSIKRYSSLSIMVKSMLAAGVLVCVIGSFAYLASGSSPWVPHQSGDIVEEAQKAERQNAFATLGVITFSSIQGANIITAIDGMGLPQASRDALLASLKEEILPATPPASASTPIPAQETVAPANVSSEPVAKMTAPSPAPAATKTSPIRLAWITLWDTDAEDGDVVRIDSQGYSRTITLAKQPVTFAIPVPSDGTISVTGIRDGEGGGITVGLASGESRAVFPIMSVGQTLGLKVRVR